MEAKDLENGDISRQDTNSISNLTDGAALARAVTAGTIPPDVFERLYLQPQVSEPSRIPSMPSTDRSNRTPSRATSASASLTRHPSLSSASL
jgi:hypothetical protein